MSDQLKLAKILDYTIYIGDLEDIQQKENIIINTINPHSYAVAKSDPDFKRALKSSDVLIPDGIGIVIADLIINHEKIKKIAGADLHEYMLSKLNSHQGSCFYLGSTNQTLSMIKKKLAIENPNIKANFFSPPFKDEFNESDSLNMIREINIAKPDVLFVGMTAPKQEKWVYNNRAKLNVKIICSIGAVFDFYSGNKKRASASWINLGLEWLPRLVREPRRMMHRNFISSPIFVRDVMWELLKGKIKSILKFRSIF